MSELVREEREREGREAAAASDRFDDILASLPETWARLPAGADGREAAAAYLRAAYGAGYVDALEGSAE